MNCMGVSGSSVHESPGITILMAVKFTVVLTNKLLHIPCFAVFVTYVQSLLAMQIRLSTGEI